MDFEHQHVVQAMRASFNNHDKAVQYLIGGIPESAVEPAVAEDIPSAAAPSAPTTAAATTTTSTPSLPTGGLQGIAEEVGIQQVILWSFLSGSLNFSR